MPKITFRKCSKVFEVPSGTELRDTLKYGTPLRFGCLQGDCGVCKIEIIEGENHLSRPTLKEKLTLKKQNAHSPCRLACQCALTGDITLI